MSRKNYTRIEWTEDRLAKLGKQSDTSLADQLGVSWSVVIKKRKALGIPRFEPIRALFDDRPELLVLLGKESDRAIGEMLGVSGATVGKYRSVVRCEPKRQKAKPRPLPEAAIPYLGKETDASVAARFDVSADTVFSTRKRLGIPRLQPLVALLKERPELKDKIGVMPDSQFAELAEVSLATVRRFRRALGRKSVFDRNPSHE